MSELTIITPRAFLPLLQPARYKGIHGGRGSGKSNFFAEMLIERCIMQKTDAVCIRENQKSLDQSVKKLLESKIVAMGVGQYFEVQDSKIKCPFGGIIIFQGMQNHTAESIKSLDGFHIAWVEEAQTMSQKSLELLRPTMREAESELWFSWNPRLATDPVDQLLRGEHLPPRALVVEANYPDNPWFMDTPLVEEMEYDKKRDFDKYQHVWLGQYQANSEARVFKNWSIEEFEAPLGAIFRLGADWGFSVDPSVLVRCYIEGKALYVDYEAYMVGCEIDNLPTLFMSVPDSECYSIVADSARPETISYMRKHGFPKMLAAVKGARSLEEGVEFLKSYDIIVHPRCQHLIDELKLYSYKLDPLTQAVTNVLEDKDNHVIDSLRYACEGARRAIKSQTVARKIPMPTRSTPGGWLG